MLPRATLEDRLHKMQECDPLLVRGMGYEAAINWTFLMYAAEKGYSEVVRGMIRVAADDINKADIQGWTPLMRRGRPLTPKCRMATQHS
jgi:hypothetical protein